MRGSFKLLFTDKLIKTSIIASVVLIFLHAIITFVTVQNLPPLVPLLNSQPWGIERLAPSTGVLIILPVFLFIFLVNNLFSALIYKNNSLIARILSFNSMLFIFLGVVAYMQIIFLAL